MWPTIQLLCAKVELLFVWLNVFVLAFISNYLSPRSHVLLHFFFPLEECPGQSASGAFSDIFPPSTDLRLFGDHDFPPSAKLRLYYLRAYSFGRPGLLHVT